MEGYSFEGGHWRVNIADTGYVAYSIVLALPFEQTQKLLPTIRLDEQYSVLNTKNELALKMARQVIRHSLQSFSGLIARLPTLITRACWIRRLNGSFMSRVFADMRRRREATSNW